MAIRLISYTHSFSELKLNDNISLYFADGRIVLIKDNNNAYRTILRLSNYTIINIKRYANINIKLDDIEIICQKELEKKVQDLLKNN